MRVQSFTAPVASVVFEAVEETGWLGTAPTNNAVILQGGATGFQFWDSGNIPTNKFPGTMFRVHAVNTTAVNGRTGYFDWALGRRDAFGNIARRRLTWECYISAQLEGAMGIASDAGAFTAAASYAGYAIQFGTNVPAGQWQVVRNLAWGGADEVVRGPENMSADWHHIVWQYTDGVVPEISLAVDGTEWIHEVGPLSFPVPGGVDSTIFAPFLGGRVGVFYNVANRLTVEYLS